MAYRNAFDVVESVHRDFPGLINDGIRFGQFVDQCAHRLNRIDGEIRWGRKARQAGGGNPNGDGLCYLNDVNDRGNKIIVDIIVNGPDPGAIDPKSAPAWQEHLGGNPGNGFWMEPISPAMDVPGQPPAPPPPAQPSDTAARLVALEQAQAALAANVEANRVRMEAINDKALPRYIGQLRVFGFTVTVVSVPEK